VGPRTVRFTFTEPDREMPLLMGLPPDPEEGPVGGRDFADSGTSVVPITSAPYRIESFEPGRFVTLRRNPDYWGKDLPFMRGQAEPRRDPDGVLRRRHRDVRGLHQRAPDRVPRIERGEMGAATTTFRP
jgi:ABC-type oligopeptide transport system substrate-binding subunit